jgi:glycosyltransferase involved in cell wall biosynthesis
MRVLTLTNLYPNPYQPHRAPFNRHRIRLLNAQHPNHVIAPIAWTDEARAWWAQAGRLPPGRRVLLDGVTIDHPRYFFPPRGFRGWYGWCFRASVARAFWRAVADFRPDIVYTPWAYPDGWAAVQLARRAGLPVVVQVLGSDIRLLDQYPARRAGTVETVRAADGVVAVSEELAGQLRAMGVAPGRIRVIYDGVDPAVFFPGARSVARARVGLEGSAPLILFVGNLVPVKGVDLLLEACTRLRADGADFRAVVVGQGPLGPALREQARRLGLTDRVTFPGPIPQASLPDWYRAANVFVLPSRSEGVPNVLLEASACGAPWVATGVGGIPEIAHLGASRLVPPEDPHSLARAVREALSAPPLQPPSGPRSLAIAVAELAEFLENVITAGPTCSHPAGRG